MNESATLLEIRELRYRHPQAQPGDDFELRLDELTLLPGSKSVCIGPSGSGKSTLLQLMAGILLPSSGSVKLGGLEWAAQTESERRRRRISQLGLVFQEFELLEHLSVRENILLPYFVNDALSRGPEADAAVQELAESTGIAELLNRKPRKLSHGERQRVAICRALVTHPPILLADEPTGNLDPKSTQSILTLLLAEVERLGSSLVMVTHDHSLLGDFDHVIDLEQTTSACES